MARRKKQEQRVAATNALASKEGATPWHVLAFALGIGLCVFVVYMPAMEGTFIWDDDAHVTKPELRSMTGLFRIWFELGATQQYYPLLHSAFWLEHRLWGDSPAGYHLVNVALHVAAATLVYVILLHLKIPGAFFAAAVFALHPVHVESVAWIAEQKNTLSAVLYLGAMLLYLRFDESRNVKWYAGAAALFLLGLMAKTVTATLPAALLVIFWWQRGQIEWRRDILPLIPYFVVGAAAGMFTAWVERKLIGAEGADFQMSFLERGLVAGRAPWFYFSKLVWPTNLIFIYPRWAIDPRVWWQWLFPLATIAALITLWMVRTRWRAPLAGVLFFTGTLFPALGFFNVYPFIFSFVADHFQYLASLGIIALLAAGITLALHRYLPESPGIRQGVCISVLIVLAILTSRQATMYGNIVKLYETTIARNSECWLAHLNLGTVWMNSGQPEPALRHFEKAYVLRPNHADIRSNLGIVLFQVGRQQEGLEHLEAAAQLAPSRAEAQHDLSNALLQLNLPQRAVEFSRKAVKLQPDAAQARHGLGVALIAAGRFDEAATELQVARDLAPQNLQIHDALVRAYFKGGEVKAAGAAAHKALEIAQSNGESEWINRFTDWIKSTQNSAASNSGLEQ